MTEEMSFEELYTTYMTLFNKEVSPGELEVAERVYAGTGFSVQDLDRGFQHYLRQGKAMTPNLGDIIHCIREIHGIDDDSLTLRAHRTFDALIESVDETWSYVFPDIYLKQAFVDCFGSIADFAQTERSENPRFRQLFTKRYLQLVKMAPYSAAEEPEENRTLHGRVNFGRYVVLVNKQGTTSLEHRALPNRQ